MFDLENIDELKARQMSCQVLAFVGDAVYSLYIRNKLVLATHDTGQKLHDKTTNFVSAMGQSESLDAVIDTFTVEEKSVYKRGRNYHTKSVSKNANIIDYKRATGLECVLGYLYLIGKCDRLNEILDKLSELR